MEHHYKFRNYKNFVFLYAVLGNILGCLLSLITNPIQLLYAISVLYKNIKKYAITVRNHWVIVV